MKRKIKTALISVSDKSGLFPVLKILKKYKIKILSSGGTFNSIRKLGFKCTEVSRYTGEDEMLDGRVKTLHPKIHAGILFNRDKKSHLVQMKKKKFDQIDLLIVNFYPFRETIRRTTNSKSIIENIDIGGPTIVRGAAKNYKDVVIITDAKDYSDLIIELKKHQGKTSIVFRERMASKAYGLTAYYDSVIAEWFNKKLGIKFPEKKIFHGTKLEQLRYGENPHQEGSIYTSNEDVKDHDFKLINGKQLSFNNYNDIFAGLEILLSEKRLATTVIIKHANPCGVSTNNSALNSFKYAKASDPVSAFGGVVACNFKVNKKIAVEMNKTFFEVIMANGFDDKAINIFKKKKNMRLIDISNLKFTSDLTTKTLDNFFLLQEKDKMIFNDKDLKFVTKNKPTKKEIKEMRFAFNICKFVKSNAIVIVKDNSTIGIGAGQQNRLDSSKIAVQKAKQFQSKKLINSVAASDAFFPFADGIKTLIHAGVKLIIQPGGSIRDKEVIEAANKAGIKMVFTGIRHFNH